jgi:hypothetical protein
MTQRTKSESSARGGGKHGASPAAQLHAASPSKKGQMCGAHEEQVRCAEGGTRRSVDYNRIELRKISTGDMSSPLRDDLHQLQCNDLLPLAFPALATSSILPVSVLRSS